MADDYFVGNFLTAVQDNGKTLPVSRVTLVVDSDVAVTAGDDSGYEIRAECPFATQTMADGLLERLRGYQYQMFSADAVRIDPAAELGDTLTVGGLYGVISHVLDDGTGFPDVSAVGEAELEDEYPTEGPLTQEFNLKIARTRSLITKTAEEVKIEVKNDLDGLSSEFDVQLQSVTAQVSGLGDAYAALSLEVGNITTTVKDLDGNYTLLEQTVSEYSVTVDSISENMSHTLRLGADGMTVQDANGEKVMIGSGNLNLSGAITFDDLQGSDSYDYYNDRWTYTGLKGMVDQAQYNAAIAKDLANTAQGIINQWGYNYYGTTYIDGKQLMTGTVTASKLQGGTVSLLSEDGNTAGGIKIVWTDTYDYGLDFYTNYGGIRLSSAGNLYLSCPNTYNHTGANILMGYDATISINAYTVTIGEYINSNIYPIDNMWNLGAAAYRWKNIFALNGAIQTSDQRLKKDIEDIPQKYLDMLMRLRPVRYKNIEGTFGRYHVGFVAQEVKAAMDELGIDSTEFGGYVADLDEDGNPVYMLRYEEFSGILWGHSQELTKRVSTLEERVEALEGIA